NAEHVRAQLGGAIPLIVDGGQSQVGIESTVLDLSEAAPRILRPGMVHAESLAAVCGPIRTAGVSDAPSVLRSPGLLEKHYSPKARVVVWEWTSDADLHARLAGLNAPSGSIQIIAHTRIPGGFDAASVSVIPHDAEAFARALYAEWHRCDAAGAKW